MQLILELIRLLKIQLHVQYLSKEIVLENPASSIKVILAAHVNEGSDIRAFFATNNKPGLVPVFTPFPGYANLNEEEKLLHLKIITVNLIPFVTKSDISLLIVDHLIIKNIRSLLIRLPSFRTYRIKLEFDIYKSVLCTKSERT